MKKTVFIKNALILTVSSLILRFAGIIFKVWLASLIGSEGIGLYQLIFSVYMLVSTFASSGISTAVTRLIAEETALGSKKGCVRILRRSIELTIIIAFATLAIVFFGAKLIAVHFLGDIRAVAALRVLPFSLPFMGVSSCLRGYFIARRKAEPSAVAQIAEQAVRIIAVVLLVKAFIDKGLGICCAAVMFGDCISEALGLLVLYISYIADKKKLNSLVGRNDAPKGTVRRIMHIALPITSGRYLNTALRTAENLLVPKNLAKFPATGKAALSQFGMIKGMALPILFFPSAILGAVSTLLIPEMSEAAARKRQGVVRSTTENILKMTAVIAFIFSAVFFVGGEEIGNLIYGEESVGFLIKALAPIVPLMYLDSISDGILKGLDQQGFTFKNSVFDSFLRIILILLVLPKSGLRGFLGIMYFSNILTCFLNVGRLIKVSGAKFKFIQEILLPLISAFCIALLSDTLLRLFSVTNSLVYIILLCAVCLPLYFIMLFLLGTVTAEDIKGVLK